VSAGVPDAPTDRASSAPAPEDPPVSTGRTGSAGGTRQAVLAQAKAQALLDEVARRRASGQPLRFSAAKPTSNLFRQRSGERGSPISLAGFDAVERVDADAGIVVAQGMVRYVDLVGATLAHGTMPMVVPQLKSITLGGAVAGVGIEATSFRHGLVHETIAAMDILTGDGRIVHSTPDNEHRDLFHGFPNSYGTLGYALRVAARTQPVQPFVHAQHAHHQDAHAFFADVARAATDPSVDFLDGVVFGARDLVLTRGRFVARAPYASDYTFERIYYRSLQERSEDFLTTRDYLWRWDTDWFWCSRHVLAQHPVVRRLYGRRRLNSITYQRIMRWNSRWGVTRALSSLRGRYRESVIQDIDIPIAHAPAFLAFLHDEIRILPIWICPIRPPRADRMFPLYPMQQDTLYVNFGFWDVIEDPAQHAPGHFNRLIEARTAELRGIKSLYSDAYFEREAFDAAYGGAAWRALKARYDPQGTLGDLYAKCVQRR
jgi:FAD/FMN-containing dehydrogenase